ncbi:hypothetical protein GFS24_05060 [Chitinophaga sp. SYP-B3965]|uniref:hypothetical protein n=1 Tax=Chitinophaga sp. SYP-B3965 TaxID=2663120 RepID=UPI0012997D1C|nr:hypothetical protein [Chitinophaga sp. SYP-B3965]MRG44469.1 hypothetical protein [Chitinophaga sp. SYP-B3965]
MEYSNIRALLEKYWACETTEEDEAELRIFYAMNEDALPADLQEAAPLFQYYHDASSVELPEIEIHGPWEETKIIRPFWQGWMKYAAVLLVALGVGHSVYNFQQKNRNDGNQLAFHDTFDDPKVAYEETQKALAIISKNLNKGKEQMEKLSYFNDATGMIQGNNN